MKYFIIAGEQSGDLHGSNLVKELFAADHNAEIYCWGGDLMEAAGAELLMHYRKTAIMGLTAILRNLGTFIKHIDLCKKQIDEYKPDAVILIDFPGFNLRIAKSAKRSGFRVFYYISPKFWAWKENRVKKVKKYVDRMFIIFPFETEFYKKHGIKVEYFGNPLSDEIEKKSVLMPGKRELITGLQLDERPVIALLAGSRKHEVTSILPQMIRVIDHFPDYQFVLAGARNLSDELYIKITGNRQVRLVREKTYELLKISEAALVASGTATLETALFGVPQVVCYKGDFFSMLAAWILIRVKFISLVNLIMNKEVVKELLGYSLNKKNLLKELSAILPGAWRRNEILSDYRALRDKLGPSGASRRIVLEMVRDLKSD
ncbi:MAG: lipid-A-disaccharide synthase [Bacteroidales bacterium]|nr:lipid-A-disaccharide synthase [Bacteroidales bacterium]